MELNSSVNTFIGGMNLDSDISLLRENQYTYAENIRLLANEDSTTGVLQNRDCLKKFKSQLKEGERILGTTVTRVFKDSESVECIVVITLDNDVNNIYLIYINDEVTWELLLHANIGWSSDLKIVANYESDTVSKIYVCDGIHHIKVINLNKDYSSNDSFTENSFDIAPLSNMQAPVLYKITDGQLYSGVIQYAYLLFSKHGPESSISQVSELINIPKKHSSDNTLLVKGGNNGEISNIGCLIKIVFDESIEFDMFRLYRIRYGKNHSVPEIFIITEFQIPADNEIIYSDTQDTYLSEITVDEFNMLTLTEFSPKIIEKHENRLFAAGITEDTWDAGEYDARAYRCDSTGYIELHHSNIRYNITGMLNEEGKINGIDVPTDHDCVNPSNAVMCGDYVNTYIYGIKNGEYIIGGTGPNISYEFCFTDVVCSDVAPMYSNLTQKTIPSVSLDLKCEYINHKKINITDQKGNIVYTHWVEHTDGVMPNYSDSYFTSKFLGYQRDEIYRFGIVFYNKKDLKTPVYWIGDIRMPSQTTVYDVNTPWFPFHFNQEIPETDLISSSSKKRIELLGKSMGVKFTVKNIPEGAVKWEIVRCPRTELDRTIISQGVLNSLIHFDTWGENSKDLGDSDIRPTAILNFGKDYNVVEDLIDSTEFEVLNDYVEFISPELCVSRNSLLDNLKNQNLCFVNWLGSLFPPESEGTWDTPEYTANSTFVAIRLDNVYTNVPEESPAATGMSSGGLYLIEDNASAYVHFGANDTLGGGTYGNALLFKAYLIGLPFYEYLESWKKLHTIKNAIVSNILPRIGTIEDAKQYAQPIGDKNYINTSVAARDSLNNHGVCAVFQMDLSNGFVVGYNQGDTITDEYGITPVVNIKTKKYPYNGNSYVSRINSTYIPCAQHHDYYDTSACVFGGDTYLGIFDYTHTTVRQYENDPSKEATRQLYVNCYIPLESTVNMNLFNSDTYSKTVNGKMALNLIQYEPFVSSAYTQTKALYEYNSAYSVDGNAQVFVPELLYTDENPIYETRITCSELKTNNEIIDSWTKFKFANYLDVDNSYGKITNLKSFNGKLLFWQDSSVGVAAVNERSLITDNNISALTLGTGGILVRYDYHTTLNGSSVCNDRSICNSTSTLYWYDQSKNEICAINNTVIELSKVKGVKSWTNKLDKHDALGWYDWKYNEVLFQHPSDEKERSLVFNELLNVFTSFYDYPVSHVAQMTDKLVTFDSFGNLYLHGAEENYEPFTSNIKYVINKDYSETKVYDNVWFDALFNKNELVKSVVFKTKTQETKPISYKDIENREDTYRFPIPRDKNGVARMRGKYLICDYTFDCINDGDFKIPYIKTTFRISRV